MEDIKAATNATVARDSPIFMFGPLVQQRINQSEDKERKYVEVEVYDGVIVAPQRWNVF